ncbi:MAG TPA: hypothetical protein VIK59_03735 [Verrucomicrobiae bacterium]
MKAKQVIELIQSLEPVEIEKLFILIKEYETEVRRRQASTRYIPLDEEFEKAVDKVFAKNDELFRKLAEYEAQERKASVKYF